MALVADGDVRRGFCRLLERDGDIEVVQAVADISSIDIDTCVREKRIVVVGPNVLLTEKPPGWDRLEVVLVSPNPVPGRLPGVTEVPMDLTGTSLREGIRHLARAAHR